MIHSQDIQFWQIRKRENRRKPYEVRWRVDVTQHSRSFLTKALAENYRAKLMTAARAGQVFGLATGEPVAWEQHAETFYAHARAYVALQWKAGGAGNSRKSLAIALTTAVLAMLDPRGAKRNQPQTTLLRKALISWAFRPPAWPETPEPEIAAALEWVENASRLVSDLSELETLRGVLGALALRVDGKPAAHNTIRRRRTVLYGCLDHAVERKLLGGNPLAGLKMPRRRTSQAVDPRTVPDLAQAQELLAGVANLKRGRGPELHAFFCVLYYSGMRPSEARCLRFSDCTLPPDGWGHLTLGDSTPEPGSAWTDDGNRYEQRELKHRAPGEIRTVPIPPILVAIIKEHVRVHGTAPDGRLFWDGNDRVFLTSMMYQAVWRRLRKAVLSEAQQASGFCRRPYDLRHGNASLLLNAGVPATEVARRLGHSVAMLYTTYAHWLHDLEELGNARIDDALGDQPPAHGPAAGQDDEQDHA